MEEFLIVDGYNIIGDWPELRSYKKNKQLEEARDELIKWLIEYQAVSGRNVILVFDAHQVPGIGKKFNDKRITVYYTKENETADELIEKLVNRLYHRKNRIYVATSDYTEQTVIFAQGALRISARELSIERELMQKTVKKNIKSQNKKFNSNIMSALDEETLKKFESWRRKK